MSEEVKMSEVKVLRLYPGDILVFRIDEPASQEAIEHAHKSVEVWLKKHGLKNRVMILSAGLDIEIVREESL
jgi:hypothetical protein